MTTLYQKYRPQNFKEIVNQNHVKITLQNEIQTNNIAHAYLFCGPRGIGKTTFARVFSRAVNCEERKKEEHDPCNKCKTCQETIDNKSLDILEIDAASHTGVDNVRENIIASARVVPSKNKYKIFIIDEIHMLSTSAFNALLKIIEEPPKTVIFILCTTEIHKIPATIISRCQRFDFKRISVNDITEKLQYITSKENIQVDRKILEAIARQSEGHMRDAESILGQIIAISGKNITEEEASLVIPRSDLSEIIKLINYLVKKDASSGVALVNKLVDDGVDLLKFTSDLIEILRKIMITKVNPQLIINLALELGENFEEEISEISKNIDLTRLIKMIEKFASAKNKIKNNFIMQLPLELVIIELGLASASSNLEIAPKTNIAIKNPPQDIPKITAEVKEEVQESITEEVEEEVKENTENNIEQNISVNNTNLEINTEEIKKRWRQVLDQVKEHNHSLSFIMQTCEPRELVGNQLCLVFKYKFHKDKISAVETRVVLENILKNVYGVEIKTEAIVDENMNISKINSSNVEVKKEVSDPENKEELEDVKKEDDKVEEVDEKDNDSINDLLKTFGGKVVK